MRPKTKPQIEACKINDIVPQLTDGQFCSIIEQVQFPAFNDKDGGYICGCCGSHIEGGNVCPHCLVELHYDDYFKKHRVYKNYYEYVAIHTKIKGWSVDRYFLINVDFYKGAGYTLKCYEIIRQIGCHLFTANVNGMQYVYENKWSKNECLFLRKHTNDATEVALSYARWAKPMRVDTFVHHKPQLFTIAQCHRKDFKFWASNTHYLQEFWNVIKNAYRHNIEPNGDYVEYLRKLRYMGRLPKGIVPVLTRNQMVEFNTNYADFLVQNCALARYNQQKYANRRRELERYYRQGKNRERMAAANYARFHKKYFGIFIKAPNLTIRPLKNIKEFQEEGNAMHHCVYDCKYYTKKQSLLMTAQNSKGKRLATVEYDLANNKVLQCRAACNQIPERYEEIVQLVQTEMNKFNQQNE